MVKYYCDHVLNICYNQCYCVVPSAPTSIQIETVVGQASQLLVTWQPPSTPNGIITQYASYCFVSDQVHLGNGSGSGDEEPSTSYSNITSTTVTGSILSAIVDGLKPYTSYDCFVTGFTSAGEGEASYVMSGTTYESSKFRCAHIHDIAHLLSFISTRKFTSGHTTSSGWSNLYSTTVVTTSYSKWLHCFILYLLQLI